MHNCILLISILNHWHIITLAYYHIGILSHWHIITLAYYCIGILKKIALRQFFKRFWLSVRLR